MTINDLIGRRLRGIYGYQQRDIEDIGDDESALWLEFEGDIWVTTVLEFAPAIVSPCIYLRYYFYSATDCPMQGSAVPFTKNPAGTQAFVGLTLLADLQGVSNQFEALEQHLGFGADHEITQVLRLGFLNPFCNGRGSGLGVGLMAADEILATHKNAIAKNQKEKSMASPQPEGIRTQVFYLARKLSGLLLIILGSVLLWEMATMLSSSDLTRTVVFGIGGCGLMLIMGGWLCLIAKKGKKAFDG